ncbi:Fur family transcriptional regulator [Nocardioides jishulii]|uniref:Transcriptional repressor n=1 Tax=Nocardioides jishulii TaxID=2575440 RepID=A0A4U2YSZ1_9ACTN|nr:transcriptional repressor [Nocardioides jishulii]QCX26452.1 transcriptional repressor [Nocardioides jishulii]TKI63742.1 transcriptional repressor [Nocardioides jishulii]
MADELASRLRTSGYRMTPQRQRVLAAVEELGHATPDEVHAHLAGAVNQSTVYRNLEVLEELGLVRHTHLSDRAPTYHSARAAEHFHLICRNCQGVTSVPLERAEAFARQLRDEFGFVADVGHVAVFGQCAACSSASGGAAAGPATAGHALDNPASDHSHSHTH